ncbi:hypothetical protein E2562_009766 [Oryza meyeriana var. granulata]|uniref:Uncharacterized protein n=1 Tax=Oryza meyeriana var. granulata TaxID=110450 RepID=A0A6G1E8X9_9ORYZ|nr:hypothetical protein E2562_009766 [Oryza meyeriana var. granulata]
MLPPSVPCSRLPSSSLSPAPLVRSRTTAILFLFSSPVPCVLPQLAGRRIAVVVVLTAMPSSSSPRGSLSPLLPLAADKSPWPRRLGAAKRHQHPRRRRPLLLFPPRRRPRRPPSSSLPLCISVIAGLPCRCTIGPAIIVSSSALPPAVPNLGPRHFPCAAVVWSSNAAVLSHRHLACMPSSSSHCRSLVGLGSPTHRRCGTVNRYRLVDYLAATPACLVLRLGRPSSFWPLGVPLMHRPRRLLFPCDPGVYVFKPSRLSILRDLIRTDRST